MAWPLRVVAGSCPACSRTVLRLCGRFVPDSLRAWTCWPCRWREAGRLAEAEVAERKPLEAAIAEDRTMRLFAYVGLIGLGWLVGKAQAAACGPACLTHPWYEYALGAAAVAGAAAWLLSRGASALRHAEAAMQAQERLGRAQERASASQATAGLAVAAVAARVPAAVASLREAHREGMGKMEERP